MKVTAANIVTGDGKLARITLDGVATSHPYALMLPPIETERLLEEHLGRLDHSHKPYQAAKAFMKTLRAALILRSTSFGEGVDANPKRTRRKASPRDM